MTNIRTGRSRILIGIALLSLLATAVQASDIYVNSNGGDDNHTGTEASPVKSLTKGIQLAAAAGGGVVRVASGEYIGEVVLMPGVTVEGGYYTNFKTPVLLTDALLSSTESSPKNYPAEVTRLLPHPEQDRVVTADIAQGEATLRNVVVFGPDSSKHWSQSSYAAVLRGPGTVHLNRVKLVAGLGGPGVKSQDGTPTGEYCKGGGGKGTARDAEAYQADMDCPSRRYGVSCPDIRTLWCQSDGGGQGESVTGTGGKALAIGGDGGAAGSSRCHTTDWYNPEDGHPGGPGGTGSPGAGGQSNPDRIGGFALRNHLFQWVGATGGQGGAGEAGAGGGGGGSGGSASIPWFFCSRATVLGAEGGTGGRGGCGGGGGSGGAAGGGSFAIVVEDAKLVTDGIGIVQSHGGPGGAGGDGGGGKEGEDKPPGKPANWISCGGIYRYSGAGKEGGKGGDGGQGGGGAGGNGGPSVALALIGKASVQRNNLFKVVGTGTGGDGGKGGKVNGEPYGDSGELGFTSADPQGHRFPLVGP